jgi:glucuronosyltransferase
VLWVAQQHVLAHPAVRIFMTHGRLNSIGEVVYAHVPLIILPGFSDQYFNAAKVKEAKIDHIIDRNTVTSDLIAGKLKMVHTNYDEYVRRLLRLHQLNELEGGRAKQAAKLIEGWLLTGYSNLFIPEHNLPFLIVTSLDVRLTLLRFPVLNCCQLFRSVKFLIGFCLSSAQKEKQA